VGLIVTALHGLTDARQYQDLWCWAPFFLLLGLYAAGLPVRPVRSRGTLLPASGAVALALGAALWLGGSPLAAWQADLGAIAQVRAELSTLNTDEATAFQGQAVAHYERAITLAPGNRTARQRLGILLDAEDQFEAAVPQLEAAYAADPANRTTWKALGLAYVWAGRLDEGEPLLRQVPGMADELNTWGNWRQSRGQIAQALSAYRMSLRLQPDQPALDTVIATLEAQTGVATD
jgi:tetratricopeptide (TPR) repeat protein